MVTIEVKQFLADHLKIWEDEGIPAPKNELQSIQAWLSELGTNGPEITASKMRNRMILLMKAAGAIHDDGKEAEDKFGIFEKVKS